MDLTLLLNTPWAELSLVAFDTETSGAYPIGNEIVEVGMVRWEGGREVDTYRQLIHPRKPMDDEVIKIHGITNEMLEGAPSMERVIGPILDFLGESVLVAHHAPFDVGFLMWDIERFGLKVPVVPALCSSLIARKLIQGSENHKLQTLIKHLNLEAGPAHRAESDARACLHVLLHCLQKMGPKTTFSELIKLQGKELRWKNYSILDLKTNRHWRGLVEAIENDQDVEFIYKSGSMKGQTRRAKPYGIVRNPDGDYMVAQCLLDQNKKRFYLKAIEDSMACISSLQD